MIEEVFLNKERTKELWATIKTIIAEKADLTLLDEYATADAVATAITTALTAYATNSQVTDAIAEALADYMTKSEINDAIAEAISTSTGISFKAVEELPETGENNIIYFVPNNSEGDNIKDEYMWLDSKWERIGSTKVDLTNYWSKDELTIMTSEELKAILDE